MSATRRAGDHGDSPTPSPLRSGSLCTGYGGLDRAIDAVLRTSPVWLCEFDQHASKAAELRFPGVPNLHDLTALDWEQVPPVDVLTAGYPCQPFSQAGRRKGTNDARHLWPFIRDAVRVLRPGVVVLENVAGHLSLGADVVLGDLAGLGFDAEWCLVRASDVGACHLRARLFIVATDPGGFASWRDAGAAPRAQEPSGWWPADEGDRAVAVREDAANAHGGGRRTLHALHAEAGGQPVVDWGAYGPAVRRHELALGRRAPAPVDGKGRLSPRFVEWMMMLPDGWVTNLDHVGVSRAQQLKILGNGVVPPQAAYAVHGLLGRYERGLVAA